MAQAHEVPAFLLRQCEAPDLSEALAEVKEENRLLIEALSKIAHGRTDNGRPLAAEKARQIGRATLIELDRGWATVMLFSNGR